VSGRHNCWCLCLAASLLTSWWKVPGGASNPCSTLSPSATLRLLFRADVTSTIRALLKELCGNFLWCCLVEVSPARTTRLAWHLQPRSRLGTLKDHWTTCWCQDQGTESTYRLNDTSGNRWLKGPGQDYASSNYEQRNLWELLSSSRRRPPLSQDLELLLTWNTGSSGDDTGATMCPVDLAASSWPFTAGDHVWLERFKRQP